MPPDSPATLNSRPSYAANAVPTIKLRVLDDQVAHARRTITRMLAGLVPATHLDDLELCVSELVTNAIKAARDYAMHSGFTWHYGDTPVHLGIACGPRWTRLDVRDPDPVMPIPPQRDLLDISGKGLLLVTDIAAVLWPDIATDHKVMHAVIPMPKVELTAVELAAARR
jgi:hypothetical protein